MRAQFLRRNGGVSDQPQSLPVASGPPNPGASVSHIVASEIDASCRLPLLVLFISAGVWLVLGSIFALISSIKFHSPSFLSATSWLTYGRVHPAYLNSILYGFCLQAGLGVALWLLARLGRTRLVQPALVTVGATFWNLGVTVGILGMLGGDLTGHENLDMPGYAALLVFLGYLFIGIWGVLTFHYRRHRALFVSQWFILTALFWFPWIYSSANLLLLTFPVRGVAQSVIAWWYSANLQLVWLGLVGLATAFYFVPKLTGRDLHSHYLALFAFWTLILFGPWAGIPGMAPVPAWIPTLSALATILLILPVISVPLNIYQTIGRILLFSKPNVPLSFVLFGVAAFVLAGLLHIFGLLADTSQMLYFTWYTPARVQLHFYGFFVMIIFGAIYYILPLLTGAHFVFPKLVRVHFWLAAAGIILISVPLVIGGIVQANGLQNARAPFLAISKSTLPFLRVSTIGDLCLLLGHLAFVGNMVALALRYYRRHAEAAYALATADLFRVAEAKS